MNIKEIDCGYLIQIILLSIAALTIGSLVLKGWKTMYELLPKETTVLTIGVVALLLGLIIWYNKI